MDSLKPMRYSRQREKILELLKESKDHPSADILYGKLRESFPSVSLGTVYRNLSLLHEQGLVNRIMHEVGPDRFDADICAHSHFYCEKCGTIYDIYENSSDDSSTNAVNGHKINRQTTSYYGICSNCNKKNQ